MEEVGKLLKGYRKHSKLSMEELASKANISRGYLSRIESGNAKPSPTVLLDLTSSLGLSVNESASIWNNLGYSSKEKEQAETIQKLKKTQAQTGTTQGKTFIKPEVRIPSDLKSYFSDSAIVDSTPFGIQVSFAQTSTGNATIHNVVSRVGMSREHAEALVKALQSEIGRFDKHKEKQKNDNQNQ